MTWLILLGHSHMLRLRDALRLRGLPPSSENSEGLKVLFHDVYARRVEYADSAPQGGVQFNAALLAEIAARTGQTDSVAFATLFGGNGHVVFGLTKHPRPFDVVIPEMPDLPLDATAELVPYAYLSAAMQGQAGSYLWQVIALRKAVTQPVLCLESPPPYGDDEYVRTHLGSYIPDPVNTVAATLRLKLWRTHSDKIRTHCVAHNIEFLPVPAETVEAPGYMVRAGYGPDATHGNDWFGERVLQQLEARFGKPIVSFAEFS